MAPTAEPWPRSLLTRICSRMPLSPCAAKWSNTTRESWGRTGSTFAMALAGGRKKDNDITVTTLDTAAVGENVILVRGKLGGLNRDFGSGYSYSVIIEDGKVLK